MFSILSLTLNQAYSENVVRIPDRIGCSKLSLAFTYVFMMTKIQASAITRMH